MTTKFIDSRLADDWSSEESPSHVANGKFRNRQPVGPMHWWDQFRLLPRYLLHRNEAAQPPDGIPVRALTRNQLLALPNDRTAVIRLGHSSVLLKISGKFWLIDPVFSERASPFRFAGPKRFHSAPISIEQLPDIRGVLISHNHYDHLDKDSIRKLKQRVDRFYVPLGVSEDLRNWGIAADKITEFDWWQAERVDELTLVAMPAQHFSGRGLSDKNASLWCSWALRSHDTRLFYSGDSGYFDEFSRIGNEYGPFDLTLLEAGAYDDMWPHVHMRPEQTLQAHIDLCGKQLLPVHNSTFRLAFHAWDEPLERIRQLAAERQISLLTPEIGQIVTVGETNDTGPWWQDLPAPDEATKRTDTVNGAQQAALK